MKKRGFFIIPAILLAAALCACAGEATEGSAEPEAAGEISSDMAGHYIIHGFCNNGSYIYNDVISGYLDINEDGTGYLDWGEDNQGPISGWTADGETLTFKAGVATITGTVKDGIMVLDMNDFHLWLAREDADVESLHPVSSEDFTPAAGEETEETWALAGTYYVYAIELNGTCVALPGFPDEKENNIVLSADGTGIWGTGADARRITWSPDGQSIAWREAVSGMAVPYSMSVRSPGVLAVEDTDKDAIYYYAKADADVSRLNARPME